MKKEQCTYKIVSSKDLKPIITATDPLNANRLPIGVELKVLKDIVEVPPVAGGALTTPWQAIQLMAPDRELYFVSPRVFLGLGYQNGKFVSILARNFPKIALLAFIATEPTVIVRDYGDVSMDNYETKELENKKMPIIELIGETEKERKAREKAEKAAAAKS